MYESRPWCVLWAEEEVTGEHWITRDRDNDENNTEEDYKTSSGIQDDKDTFLESELTQRSL